MTLGRDTFTEATSKPLQLHIPNEPSNGAWETLGFEPLGTTTTSDLWTFFGAVAPVPGTAVARTYRLANAVPINGDYNVSISIYSTDRNYMTAVAVMARMSTTGFSNSQVDRYQAELVQITSGSVALRIAKVKAGVHTVLASTTFSLAGRLYGDLFIDIQTVGGNPSIEAVFNGYIPNIIGGTYTAVATATDTSDQIVAAGRPGFGYGISGGASSYNSGATGQCLDFLAVDFTTTFTSSGDTARPVITEGTSVLAKLKILTATDTLTTVITESGDTLYKLVLRTATDTLTTVITESSPSVDTGGTVKSVSLMIRAGLVTDVEPSLVLTHWPANQWTIPAVISVAETGGTVLTYVFTAAAAVAGDTGSTGRFVIDAASISSDNFEGVLAAHLGSLFPSSKDQRGTMRLYAWVSRQAGGKGAIRGVLNLPTGIFPITQDPRDNAKISSGVFRRMDAGLFTWPPVVGGGSKYRSGLVTQRVTSVDLASLSLLQLEALSEDSSNPTELQISGVDILPVEDGFFALLSTSASEETALQQGETLVVDAIDNPTGNYVIKKAEGATVLTENVDLVSTLAVPVMGGGLYLRPKVNNMITFLADRWTADDDLGESRSEATFEAWIEYQPRVLYF